MVTVCSRYNELIETLWNVNSNDYEELAQEQNELIETLWNVN